MNKSVLLISDQHAPYHHQDTLAFLKAIKEEIQPDRVINLGDETDQHAWSFHSSEPDLLSPGNELKAAKKYITELHSIFPVMDLVESNHGSLFFRKALANGLPYDLFKPYNQLWGVGDSWLWHFDLSIKLPNGQSCYFHHGKNADVTKLSKAMSMNAIQGHYHEKFKIEYWRNPSQTYWGMQTGCLIDHKSMAFAYNKNNLHRPILGTGVIVDSRPALVPMELTKSGKWDKKLRFI